MKTIMPPMRKGSSDHFQTKDPQISVKPLLEYVPKSKKIWCCSSGAGRMVDYIAGQGYSVTGTDIMQGFDFLDTLAETPEFDVIIENPPYSKKDKWLKRCYDLGKPFALLMPITALGEQKRTQMYKKHGIEMLMLPERTDFITPNGKEGGSWFYAAWFCHGIDLPSQIAFV